MSPRVYIRGPQVREATKSSLYNYHTNHDCCYFSSETTSLIEILILVLTICSLFVHYSFTSSVDDNTEFKHYIFAWLNLVSMLSTRKQKAQEKRSRQSDVMSDLESMNMMLGKYSRNHSEDKLIVNLEMDSKSNETRAHMAQSCEDFRSLLNTENRIENEITCGTSRLISTEVSLQISRNLDELKRDLNSQITESINSAIHETVLPSLQNSLSGLNSGLGTNVDSRASRLSRNTEGRKHQSAWGNTHKKIPTNFNDHPHSRESSLNSLDGRGDHDN